MNHFIQLTGDGTVGARSNPNIAGQNGDFNSISSLRALIQAVVMMKRSKNSIRIRFLRVGDTETQSRRKSRFASNNRTSNSGFDTQVIVPVYG